jgi:hypothetical protein
MSQDIGNRRTCKLGSGCCSFSGGSFGRSGGLVAGVRVEDQVAHELAGDGVDDADVQVLDEQDDAGSLVKSADADVVQPVVVADGHRSGLIDAVVPDPVVGVGVAGLAGDGAV